MKSKITSKQAKKVKEIVKKYFGGNNSNLARYLLSKNGTTKNLHSLRTYVSDWTHRKTSIPKIYAEEIVKYVNKIGEEVLTMNDIKTTWELKE